MQPAELVLCFLCFLEAPPASPLRSMFKVLGSMAPYTFLSRLRIAHHYSICKFKKINKKFAKNCIHTPNQHICKQKYVAYRILY